MDLETGYIKMNDKIKKTIEYYNNNAADFYLSTVNADMSYCRDKFVALLPKGAKILDAGCGSGRDSKAFIEEGFSITAFDASGELCALASNYIGQPVACMRFEEMEWQEEFDGVWACASLLHIPKKDMNKVFDLICTALKAGGIFYTSFKFGDAEEVRRERFYSDYTPTQIKELFERNNRFEILECFITGDVRENHKDERWVNVIAVKHDTTMVQSPCRI